MVETLLFLALDRILLLLSPFLLPAGGSGPADAADPQLTALSHGDEAASDVASVAGESCVSTVVNGSVVGTPKSIKKSGERRSSYLARLLQCKI